MPVVKGTIPRSDLSKLSNDSRVVLWFDKQQSLVFSNLSDVLLDNDFPNDAAAATGGVAIGQLYHTTGVVKVRLV